MKEILEALESRIKSPIFGYFSFAFLTTNWKAIFFLLFSNKDVIEKIAFFETNTNINTLLYYPLIISFSFAILYPWLNLIFLFIGTKPTDLKNSIQAETESKLLAKKKRLEIARSELLSATENALISRAKRDVELNKIEDENVREKLKLEINDLRNVRNKFTHQSKPTENEIDHIILNAIENVNEGEFQLSDMFHNENWNNLDNQFKQSLGKRFKQRVENGDYEGIAYVKRGTGNQAIYRKSLVDRLPDIQEKILSYFVGLKDGYGHTCADLSEKTKIHIDQVRHIIDVLVNKNFLRAAGSTIDDERLYELSPPGREYIVNNNLLNKLA